MKNDNCGEFHSTPSQVICLLIYQKPQQFAAELNFISSITSKTWLIALMLNWLKYNNVLKKQLIVKSAPYGFQFTTHSQNDTIHHREAKKKKEEKK